MIKLPIVMLTGTVEQACAYWKIDVVATCQRTNCSTIATRFARLKSISGRDQKATEVCIFCDEHYPMFREFVDTITLGNIDWKELGS